MHGMLGDYAVSASTTITRSELVSELLATRAGANQSGHGPREKDDNRIISVQRTLPRSSSLHISGPYDVSTYYSM
jgi:hypothetical protein